MILECEIRNYICQIELEISDGCCVFDSHNRSQCIGMLYGIQIAYGVKRYPSICDDIDITDDFRRGLIEGLRKTLFGVDEPKQSSMLDVIVNVKFELDKTAYKQFVADMDYIESECRDAQCIKEEVIIPTTECIPATLKSVCEWWIMKYSDSDIYIKRDGNKTLYDAPCDIVSTYMKEILEHIK